MAYPVSSEKEGIKIKPELMEQEKLYHCMHEGKVMLVYKDTQDVLNCYEIEEPELVEKIKSCTQQDDVEKIFEEYVKNQNLNNK